MLRRKIMAIILAFTLILTFIPTSFISIAEGETPKSYILGVGFATRPEITKETPLAKWVFEKVDGMKFRLKNSSTGLYLTATVEEKLVQKNLNTEDKYQIWDFNNHYGTKYKVFNTGLDKILSLHRVDGEPLFLPKNEGNIGGERLIYVNEAPGVYTDMAPEDGKAYYIFCRNPVDKENTPSILIGEDLALDTGFAARPEITKETPLAKWVFEKVDGMKFRLKNSSTGLYLSATVEEKIVQKNLNTEDKYQIWDFNNHYGTKYKVFNTGLDKILSLHRIDGEPLFLPKSEGNIGGERLIYVNEAPGVYTEIAPEDGKAYYVFCRNPVDKENTPSILVGKEYFLDTGFVARPEIAKETLLAKWIFEKVDGMKFRLKNKETGLYLTATAEEKIIQKNLNTEDKYQIWDFNNHYGTKYKVFNTGLDKILSLHRVDGEPLFLPKSEGNIGGERLIYVNESPGVYTEMAPEDGKAYYVFCRNPVDKENTPSILVGKYQTAKENYAGIIRQSKSSGSDIEKWVFEDAGDGKYRIFNNETKEYLTFNGSGIRLNPKSADNKQLWEVVVKGENRYLKTVAGNKSISLFREVRFYEEYDGNTFENITISLTSNGDTVSAIEIGKAYFIFSSAQKDYSDSRTLLVGVPNGEEPEVDKNDSGFSGNPAETIPVQNGKFYGLTVTDFEKANGSASYKWVVEIVDAAKKTHKLKNAASGLYLTVINGEVVQQEGKADSNAQLWILDMSKGYRYEVLSVSTGRALRLDAKTPYLGDANTSQESLIAFSELAETISRSSDAIVSGNSYYVNNWAFKALDAKGARKGGVLKAAGNVVDPGEEVEDKPFENQDKANPPIDADQPVAVKLTPVSGVKKVGSQIWIFHKVTIDPVPDIRKITDPKHAKAKDLTVGYKLQNQETGLYLTQIKTEEGSYVAQVKENDSKLQIWTIQNYNDITAGYERYNILRNVETGHQLLTYDNIAPVMLDPTGYSSTDNDWPKLVAQYGGPTAGIATNAFARLPSDMFLNAVHPEDGKGYYIYNGGNERSGSILEAEGGSVEDRTTDIPESAEKKAYKKDFVYKPDFTEEINSANPDWDLLYEAEVWDGILTGVPSSETNTYGIASKHRTYGRGVNNLAFDLMIPSNAQGEVVIALRLNDYTDIITDRTGIRLYIDKDGRVGIKYAGTSDSVTFRETGLNFSEVRRVFVEDDTDNNKVLVYFADDSGTKTLVAELEIARGAVKFSVTNTSENATPVALSRSYGYNIYKDGYISLVTQNAENVEISNLSLSIVRYSDSEFPDDPTDPNKPVTGQNIVPTVVFTIVIIVSGIGLFVTGRKKRVI